MSDTQLLPQDEVLLSDDQQCERLLDEVVRELLQLGRALMREGRVVDVADLALHVGAEGFDVAGDLRFEFVETAEFHFRTEELGETHFEVLAVKVATPAEKVNFE